MRVQAVQKTDGPSDLEALRIALAKKMFINQRKPVAHLFLTDKSDIQTKEKKQVREKSFLNKIITERSTSKKDKFEQQRFFQMKEEIPKEKRRSSLFETSSNANGDKSDEMACAGVKPTTSFFARLEQTRKQASDKVSEFSFFGRKLAEGGATGKREDEAKNYFMSSTEALAESIKPKRFKIKLICSNKEERELRLYKDTELGLACSFQVNPKGMVSSLLQ